MSRQLVNNPQKEIVSRRPGRPTEYKRRHLGIAKDYLKNFKEYGDVMPTIAGLACHIGKSRDTIYQWVKNEVDEKFSDIIGQIKMKQEQELLNNGLKGDFNPAITKLCLVSKHGYSEQNQADSAVTVNVNRDSVQISTRGQTLDVDMSESKES